jgi:hypothetical protein
MLRATTFLIVLAFAVRPAASAICDARCSAPTATADAGMSCAHAMSRGGHPHWSRLKGCQDNAAAAVVSSKTPRAPSHQSGHAASPSVALAAARVNETIALWRVADQLALGPLASHIVLRL